MQLGLATSEGRSLPRPLMILLSKPASPQMWKTAQPAGDVGLAREACENTVDIG